MSPRSWVERIQDMLEAIAEINAFTAECTYDVFHNDRKTIRAVELACMIIGEAASRIPEEVQSAHPEIPWHLMRAMRNRLVHASFSVDPTVVWDTVHQDLPPLVPLWEALVGERGDY